MKEENKHTNEREYRDDRINLSRFRFFANILRNYLKLPIFRIKNAVYF